jgi:hypothetical protein
VRTEYKKDVNAPRDRRSLMTKKGTTFTLSVGSVDAMYEIVRSIADRGEDYGWNVYNRGYTIPPTSARKIREEYEGAGWLEAYRAAQTAFRAATGESWRY